MISFTAPLENFNTSLWSYHIKVPLAIATKLKASGSNRVVCRLNDLVEFQCAIMPNGDSKFILVNKKIRDRLKLTEGSLVSAELKPDESEYGLPMPESFQEILDTDPEGNELFQSLTPGKQRTLLYYINLPKGEEGKIQRGLAVLEHLKATNNKINFKILMSMFKTS